jgi:hypothetical protein
MHFFRTSSFVKVGSGVLALPLMWESPCLIEKDPYLLELAKRRKDARGDEISSTKRRGNPSLI